MHGLPLLSVELLQSPAINELIFLGLPLHLKYQVGRMSEGQREVEALCLL